MTLALLLLGTAAQATAEPLFLNLRTRRDPPRPWPVYSGELSAIVAATRRPASAGWGRWRLDADIDAGRQGWALLAVVPATAGVVVTRFVPDKNLSIGSRRVEVEVTAPTMCSMNQAQEPVTLTLRYRTGGGERQRPVDLDHRCLLGELIERPEAEAFAELVRSNLTDPFIEMLALRASALPPASPADEVRRFARWAHFDADSLQTDPLFVGRTGVGYVLQPRLVARMGGDCKSWSVALAAYLARRGLDAAIAYCPGHVWVRVYTSPTTTLDFDLLNAIPADGPTSTARVS